MFRILSYRTIFSLEALVYPLSYMSNVNSSSAQNNVVFLQNTTKCWLFPGDVISVDTIDFPMSWDVYKRLRMLEGVPGQCRNQVQTTTCFYRNLVFFLFFCYFKIRHIHLTYTYSYICPGERFMDYLVGDFHRSIWFQPVRCKGFSSF